MDERLVRAEEASDEAQRLYPLYGGKVAVTVRCPVRGLDDFAVSYTAGVAAPARAIASDPSLVVEHTHKANSVAIVTDGSRVLGLGDNGPEVAPAFFRRHQPGGHCPAGVLSGSRYPP